MKKLLLLVSLCMTIFVGCTDGKEVPPEPPVNPVEVGPNETTNTPIGDQSPNPVEPPVQDVDMNGASGR